MTTDARLRLLDGTVDDAVAQQILTALDRVAIVVRCGPDVTGASTTAVAAFITMAARLFGQVRLDHPLGLHPNWWQAPDTAALLSALAPVRPQPTTHSDLTLVVTYGKTSGGQWGVGGGDYTVRLGRTWQPIEPGDHALGVHAASSLLISQLLLHILAPYGFSGVGIQDDYVMNLIDYQATAATADLAAAAAAPLALAMAGAGSVGTSTLALLAGAVAPALAGHGPAPTSIDVIDDDRFDPARNPYRYPALLGGETGPKASWVADRLRAAGLNANTHAQPVAHWVSQRPEPGFDGLLISSVDTLAGRADVTDALARQTLSLGVAGLQLHAQREGFTDGGACPFCDFVSVAPALTQAGVYSQGTGLPLQRVLSLLQPGARLSAEDVDTALTAGKLRPERREQMIDACLTDLFRQAYAEASLHAAGGAGDVIAIAAPQTSWFTGVLAAVEIVKQLRGLPQLDRRVDIDLTGLPPGLVRRAPAETSGRCLCRSGVRRRWYNRLYADAPGVPASK